MVTSHQMAKAGSLPVLRWPLLDAAGIDAVVTTRHGGVSHGPYESLNLGLHVGDDPEAVVANRARAAAAIGLSLDDLVFCRQPHGTVVTHTGTADRGRGARDDADALPDADGLVTTEPDVGLAVIMADCVTVVLTDPQARVLGAVHAGWRGTVARVVAVAVEAMVQVGAAPERIVAGVAPAVSCRRYQVGPDVATAAADAFGTDADTFLHPDGTDHWRFDLQAANLHVLAEAGVAPERVAVAAVDTASGDFFSDRAVRPCGRFAALARLRP